MVSKIIKDNPDIVLTEQGLGRDKVKLEYTEGTDLLKMLREITGKDVITAFYLLHYNDNSLTEYIRKQEIPKSMIFNKALNKDLFVEQLFDHFLENLLLSDRKLGNISCILESNGYNLYF